MNYFGAYNKSAIDNSSLQPWERVSAAVGCAVYDPATDDGVGTVLARADGAMYENKRAMKENAVFLVNENVEHVRAL
jgi:predicted signal transduction protein with EAL and GGDEF domain